MGPVAAAMRLSSTAGRWLELSQAYVEAGTDLLILTGYGGGSRLTSRLEEYGTEVPALRIPELVSPDSAPANPPLACHGHPLKSGSAVRTGEGPGHLEDP